MEVCRRYVKNQLWATSTFILILVRNRVIFKVKRHLSKKPPIQHTHTAERTHALVFLSPNSPKNDILRLWYYFAAAYENKLMAFYPKALHTHTVICKALICGSMDGNAMVRNTGTNKVRAKWALKHDRNTVFFLPSLSVFFHPRKSLRRALYSPWLLLQRTSRFYCF